ncbi:hypothetical protein LDENG_00237860, partial [Lucifuga dentata]
HVTLLTTNFQNIKPYFSFLVFFSKSSNLSKPNAYRLPCSSMLDQLNKVNLAKNILDIKFYVIDYVSEAPYEDMVSLKDHIAHFACLGLIYSIFIHVTLLTIICQSILLER